MDNGIGTIQMRTINTALDRVTVPSYTKGDLTIALYRLVIVDTTAAPAVKRFCDRI